ncbi:uncharacterized protein METZ01_LOCUS47342, partial [marine metagenome]
VRFSGPAWAGPATLAVLSIVLLLSACGSTADGPERAAVVPTTTILEVATTTVTPAAARSGFVAGVADGAPILGGLTDHDLGCVADRLLEELEPAEVIALTRNGPRPGQSALAVQALSACDLVIEVVTLGLQDAIEADPESPPIDAACLLEGVDPVDLAPYLEARFAEGFVALRDEEASDLLAGTPIMANTMRCSTLAVFGAADADTPAVCAGLAQRLGDMMAVLLEADDVDRGPDPLVLARIFAVTNEIFAWLVDEVPVGLQADAALVRDTTARVGDLMVEGFARLDLDDADDEEAMLAFLGVMARISAELDASEDDLDTATRRLRTHVVETCGESSSILFELLVGVGATA